MSNSKFHWFVLRFATAILMTLLAFQVYAQPAMGVQDSPMAEKTESGQEDQDEQITEIGKKLTDEQLKKVVDSVEKARSVFYDEIKPIQDRMNTETKRVYDQMNEQRQLISQLKSANDKSLERIRREIDQLTSRLDLLLKVEEILTDMDDDAVEKAIEKANEKVEELNSERSEIQKPLSEELSDVHRAYAEDHGDFGNTLKPLFKNQLEGKFSDYKIKFIGGAFSNGQVNLSFEHDRKTVSMAMIFVGTERYKKSLEKKEVFNDRYRILSESDRNLYMYTDGVRFSVTSHRTNFKVDELKEFFKAAIDQPKMNQLLDSLKEN